MDKLQRWLERIQRPPRREVANIDHWDLLLEARILQTPMGDPCRPAPTPRAANAPAPPRH